MKIREAREEDVAALMELWKEFIDFHQSTDRFFTRTSEGHKQFGEFALDRIRDNNWLVLVAVVDRQVVGHCLATVKEHPPVFVDARYGYIQDIAVTQQHRRSCIGTTLFGKAVDWFKQRGVTRIELDATAHNQISQSFWRKMGFRDFMIRMSKEI